MSKICILGGSGFVGTHLVNRLYPRHREVLVLCRNPGTRPEASMIPAVRLIGTDVYDPERLAGHFAGAGAVINLVGILNERGFGGKGFQRAHVDLTAAALEACKRAGVRRFLQMSALNAGRGESHYLKSKGAAEALVSSADGIDWTIFQPSVIFGPGDGFLNRFASLLKIAPVLPLACPNTRFQPVYVGDVGRAFAAALERRETFGQTYQLGGPRVYTLRELVSYVRDLLSLKRLIVGLPKALSRLQGLVMDFVPGKPFSSDNYKSLQLDSVVDEDGLKRLGLNATALEAVAPSYLGPGSRAARYHSLRRARHGR